MEGRGVLYVVDDEAETEAEAEEGCPWICWEAEELGRGGEEGDVIDVILSFFLSWLQRYRKGLEGESW